MATKKNWDNEEFEAQSAFFALGEPDDFLYGTVIAIRQVPDQYHPGKTQDVLDFLVDECSYHKLVNKKPQKEATVLSKGDFISFGGRPSTASRTRTIKVGQKVGIKYVGEVKAKDPKHNDAKSVKIFTPKLPSGEFEMDTAWLETQKVNDEVF